MRLFLSAIILFAGNIIPVLNAQSVIKGRVSDRDTGEPLAGVYVIY